jgi:hypothetical protein
MYNGYLLDVQSHSSICNSQIVNNSNFVSKPFANIKKIPVKIIMNDDEEVENRSIDTDSNSFYKINKLDEIQKTSKFCLK